MSASRVLWPLLGLVFFLGLSGCARAYHAYPRGCCIPYDYCPAPPLPYAAYNDCHCPTPIAAHLLEPATGSVSPDTSRDSP